MTLTQLKTKSDACRRDYTRVETNLEVVCVMVGLRPGLTAWAHYGRSVSRSDAYAVFARARRHGLIEGSQEGGKTTYTLTDRGKEFLRLYGYSV